VNRAIRAADTPPYIFRSLRVCEKIGIRSRLVRLPPEVAELAINLIETLEVQVLRGSQKQRSTGTSDTVEFLQGQEW
jgi:hypothetical protein